MTNKPIPETSPSPWPITRVGIKCWIWALIFGIALRYSFVLFDSNQVSGWLAIVVTAVTLGLGVMCFHYMWRWIAGLDEFQRELQHRAFALVFPCFLLIIVACDQLRAAKVIPVFPWRIQEAGITMLAVYGVAYVWLWWRNR